MLLDRVLALPAADQVPAARALLDALDTAPGEDWNTAFGPGTLFDAWTRTSIATGVHAELGRRIAPVLTQPGFVAIEVGAGDGRTWRQVWTGDERGTLVVVDPVAEAIERVRETVPRGVNVVGNVCGIENAELPPADLIVCSMTLHHRAGRDAAERASYGMQGPGKREILEGFRRSLRPRQGFGLLVEADVDCELHLAPGDPVLRDNLFDSYVRRCARSILADLRRPGADPTLVAVWEVLVHRWFLAQIRMADVPREDRDVYELTVEQWSHLLAASGLDAEVYAVDDWKLFHLYVLR